MPRQTYDLRHFVARGSKMDEAIAALAVMHHPPAQNLRHKRGMVCRPNSFFQLTVWTPVSYQANKRANWELQR